VRLLVGGFGLAIGVILGGPLAGAGSGEALATLLVGLGLEVVVVVVLAVLLGRAERRFRAEVVAASAEIASGAVEPVPTIGRLVRRRVTDLPWWLPGRGRGHGRSALTVLTAVGDGPARRVAALVPADLGLTTRGVPALLLVHPVRRDVAVLDDRVTAERLAQVDADPRWGAERLPTDRSVVGGYLLLGASLLLGGAVGAGLSALAVMLAT
jgi:hypothetical protein